MESVDFITTSRDHLFEMTRILVGGIRPEFMRNATSPVTVSVMGTFGDGKKIIPDAAVQSVFNIPNAQDWHLYGNEKVTRKSGFGPLRLISKWFSRPTDLSTVSPVFQGEAEFEEHWKGLYQEQNVEVSFSNSAWGSSYTAKKHLKRRELGGIAFVHNDESFEDDAWIGVWLEKEGNGVVGSNEHKSKSAAPHLKDIFHQYSEQARDWTRYIKVDVRRPELLACSRFQRALEALSQQQPVFGGL